MSSILIKNGTLVDENSSKKADLLIEDGKISKIGENLKSDGAKVIDANGMLVMPGIIDAHTH
ncbi:MAG: dihydropyrimidinase, partial [Spirochaetales bacterium]|nr:dihydropyrimidinase [Spirochaetales bacterium]